MDRENKKEVDRVLVPVYIYIYNICLNESQPQYEKLQIEFDKNKRDDGVNEV